MGRKNLIPLHGDYRKLRSFQAAQLVYDVTMSFCDRYGEKRSRTHDQMVQAARSDVQSIAEGSQAQRHIQENGTQACERGARPPRRTAAGL